MRDTISDADRAVLRSITKDGADPVAAAIIHVIKTAVNKVKADVARLDSRLTRVESEPRPHYLGVWKAEDAYGAGACVTWDGSMWIARIPSTGLKPGDGAMSAQAWALAVKRGRDARDRESDR